MDPRTQPLKARKFQFSDGQLYVALTVPAIIVTLLICIIPLMLLLVQSFKARGVDGFTLANYADIFSSRFFWKLVLSTFTIGIVVTVISLVMAYPVAYYFARNTRARNILMCIVMVPRMLPFVVVGYAFILILAPYTGLLNVLLVKQLGILSKPLNILFDLPGLIIALVYSRAVVAIGILTGVIDKIDVSLEEASTTLGYSKLATFFKVVFPLTIPGLIGASGLIFAMTITAYVIPNMLAGRGMYMVSVLIGSNLLQLGNWNLAFAQAVVVTILALFCTWLSQYVLVRYQGK